MRRSLSWGPPIGCHQSFHHATGVCQREVAYPAPAQVEVPQYDCPACGDDASPVDPDDVAARMAGVVLCSHCGHTALLEDFASAPAPAPEVQQ